MSETQTLACSITDAQGNYLRTFEAEIDISPENDLLVRGVLRDHRFAFAHTWRLRAPAYEVIEASAQQLAGEFDPSLCERYAEIKGVRIGRGFSKTVISALGAQPGAKEHLLLAIEMARVGQQVYQYTPEFEAQFPQGETPSEQAHSAWLKDRAYMSLANTCYAYRDESEALFAGRNIRCGFASELTRPQPGEKRVFWRNKRLTIERTAADGAPRFLCTSAMEDRIHDIKIEFTLGADGRISDAHSRGLRLPYHGICEDPQQRTPSLNGVQVTEKFVQQFAEHVGSASGCTHLFDLSIDVMRLFDWPESGR